MIFSHQRARHTGMFICINCRQGLMDPIRNEEEPEYTDRYQCGHCGHSATIPSMLIVISQFVSSLIGGGVAVYLLLSHLGAVMTAFQFDQTAHMGSQLALVALALVFAAGFCYTIYRGGKNFYRRYLYLHPER